VSLARLKEHAPLAIEACQAAAAAHPDVPHFDALLARALAAAGHSEEALQRYSRAAEQGDLRAMVSLGLLMEEGTGVPRNVAAAVALYERAAERGSSDGAVNLAVALLRGIGTSRDLKRAIALLQKAANNGSAQAALNLGVLADRGMVGGPAKAVDYFRRAAELGEPRAYIRAAILADEGRGTRKSPSLSADLILTGVASDYGEAANEIASHGARWSLATRNSLQDKLRAAGYFSGASDGSVSLALISALSSWRANGGLELWN
jgi:TPR repeat protein